MTHLSTHIDDTAAFRPDDFRFCRLDRSRDSYAPHRSLEAWRLRFERQRDLQIVGEQPTPRPKPVFDGGLMYLLSMYRQTKYTTGKMIIEMGIKRIGSIVQ